MDADRTGERGPAAVAVDVLAVARILRAAGGALWDQARLHGELARIEWLAERQRLIRCGVLAALCVVLIACALASAGALALVAAWDTTWRLPVAVALPLLYAVAAWSAVARLRAAWARADRAFAATREELAADLALLRSRL